MRKTDYNKLTRTKRTGSTKQIKIDLNKADKKKTDQIKTVKKRQKQNGPHQIIPKQNQGLNKTDFNKTD